MARMAAKRKREIKIPNKRRIFSKSVRHRCILYTDTWNDEAVAPNRWIAASDVLIASHVAVRLCWPV